MTEWWNCLEPGVRDFLSGCWVVLAFAVVFAVGVLGFFLVGCVVAPMWRRLAKKYPAWQIEDGTEGWFGVRLTYGAAVIGSPCIVFVACRLLYLLGYGIYDMIRCAICSSC